MLNDSRDINDQSVIKNTDMEAEVNIFTLNCWGLGLGISKNRDERMEDIGKYLSEQNYDIVFLQVRNDCLVLLLSIQYSSGSMEA